MAKMTPFVSNLFNKKNQRPSLESCRMLTLRTYWSKEKRNNKQTTPKDTTQSNAMMREANAISEIQQNVNMYGKWKCWRTTKIKCALVRQSEKGGVGVGGASDGDKKHQHFGLNYTISFKPLHLYFFPYVTPSISYVVVLLLPRYRDVANVFSASKLLFFYFIFFEWQMARTTYMIWFDTRLLETRFHLLKWFVHFGRLMSWMRNECIAIHAFPMTRRNWKQSNNEKRKKK